MNIKKILALFRCTLLISTSLYGSPANETLNKQEGKVLVQYENWSLIQEEFGLLLLAKGKPVRITSLNGVENALLRKALQVVYFGAFYQKDKQPRYFIRFSQAFTTDYYLEEKTSAGWKDIAQSSFRNNSLSLLKQFESLKNQLTVWQFEPVYSKRQLPDKLKKALDSQEPQIYQTAFWPYFWETLFTDWRLIKTSIWFSNVYTASRDNNDPEPLSQDLLYWLRDGLKINQEQSKVDGANFDNLYMTTTMSTLEQQPAFTLDFGFKHLPAVLQLLEDYQKRFPDNITGISRVHLFLDGVICPGYRYAVFQYQFLPILCHKNP